MTNPTPNKPTEEELIAKQQAALEANPSEPEPSEPAPDEEAVDEPEVEVGIDKEPEPEPSEPAPEPEPDAEPSKELYKKKFSESAKENQKIYAKNRLINKALTDADEIPEPTEEELEKEFAEWGVMNETEKMLAKETVISRKWRSVISQAKNQATKIEKWNDSVDSYIDDPKTLNDNQELEGKTEEFREFAKDEANNSVPFNILVSAFLHEQSKGKQPSKGRMFPRGSGGSNEKPQHKSDKLTLEESRQLRETDYGKWKEYLRAGKIDMSI